MLTTATGIVTQQDLLRHLQEKEEAGVFCYAQLFDAIDVQLDLSVQDLHRIAGEARRCLHGRKSGHVALVTDSFYVHALATVYQGLTREENPVFRIFKDPAAARSWLEAAHEAEVALDDPPRLARLHKSPPTRSARSGRPRRARAERLVSAHAPHGES